MKPEMQILRFYLVGRNPGSYGFVEINLLLMETSECFLNVLYIFCGKIKYLLENNQIDKTFLLEGLNTVMFVQSTRGLRANNS